jgi:glutathione S-transferase
MKGKSFVCGGEFSLLDIACYQEIRPILLIVNEEKVNKELLAIKKWIADCSSMECIKSHEDSFTKIMRSYKIVKSHIGLNVDTNH